MSEEKKPNVFPTREQIEEANKLSEKLNQEYYDKLKNTGVYDDLKDKIQQVNVIPDNRPIVSEGELNAAAEMKRQTDELIRLRDENNGQRPYVIRPDLAEPSAFQAEIEYGRTDTPQKPTMENFQVNVESKNETHYDVNKNEFQEKLMADLEAKYERLGQPQQNVPFDVIPLPSLGKVYQNKKSSMKVAYLNASDENILTNPNLLESGKFLEILINRKMLDTNLRYKDLLVGDRNAIMIWLRSTAYGSDYPIQVYDPSTGKPFETNIDLSKLKMIELNVDTDIKGHISYTLPISKNEIKFRLLTVGDLDDIESHVEKIKNDPNLGPEFLDTSTYILKKQLTSINGHTSQEVIDDYCNQMLLGDVKEFRKYVDNIESGMDMNLTVKTPGGESINTFFPLNTSFFWPNL